MASRAKKVESSDRVKAEPIEVYLTEPGQGRRAFSFERAFEYLPPDGPLPQSGDILLLPRAVTGETAEQAFAWNATVSPFRVVERQHVYFRKRHEKLDATDPAPARYVRTIINVQRLTEEEYVANPGRVVS
jgi:hypothetical protein